MKQVIVEYSHDQVMCRVMNVGGCINLVSGLQIDPEGKLYIPHLH